MRLAHAAPLDGRSIEPLQADKIWHCSLGNTGDAIRQ